MTNVEEKSTGGVAKWASPPLVNRRSAHNPERS